MEHPTNMYLQGLRELLELAVRGDVPRPTCGVCGNLSKLLYRKGWYEEDSYEWVPAHSKEWEHAVFSLDLVDDAGNPKLLDYFVPHTGGVGMWKGRHLGLRINLIEYLIGQAMQELSEAAVLAS